MLISSWTKYVRAGSITSALCKQEVIVAKICAVILAGCFCGTLMGQYQLAIYAVNMHPLCTVVSQQNVTEKLQYKRNLRNIYR